MQQRGRSVRNSAVCIMNAQYMLNTIFSLEPVKSYIDLAIGEKTEESSRMFMLSVGCLVGLYY